MKWFDPRRCYGFCSVTGNLQDKVRISVADAADLCPLVSSCDFLRKLRVVLRFGGEAI